MTPFPNTCLKSDWDLTEAIYLTYASTAIRFITYAWVKGHQDSNQPTRPLSTEAKFNVFADNLAAAYMTINFRHRPISPITESARCTLTIKGSSVNSHYTTSFREAASIPELHGYLRRKYQWSKETLRTINWKWFKAASSTYHHTDNHLMKLVYDHLPTRHVKCKKTGQSWLPDTCRYCEIEPETFDHLLKCNHAAGLEFRKALPRSV